MLAIHPFQYAPAHSKFSQPTVSDSWLQHNRRVPSTNNPDDIVGGCGGDQDFEEQLQYELSENFDGPHDEDEEQPKAAEEQVPAKDMTGDVEQFEKWVGEHDFPETLQLVQDARSKLHGTWVRGVTSIELWEQ
jgi:hypothetical protein